MVYIRSCREEILVLLNSYHIAPQTTIFPGIKTYSEGKKRNIRRSLKLTVDPPLVPSKASSFMVGTLPASSWKVTVGSYTGISPVTVREQAMCYPNMI